MQAFRYTRRDPAIVVLFFSYIRWQKAQRALGQTARDHLALFVFLFVFHHAE